MIVAVHGQGYAWNPPSLTISVGDTVRWSWEAPRFLNTGYRVFSVSRPSGTTYEGGPFNSGDAKTAKGESQPNSSVMNLGLMRFICSKIPRTKHNKITKMKNCIICRNFALKRLFILQLAHLANDIWEICYFLLAKGLSDLLRLRVRSASK